MAPPTTKNVASTAENQAAKKATIHENPIAESSGTNNRTVKEERLDALRESREEEPNLTHKQRLASLQDADPDLWGDVTFKAFKRWIRIDNNRDDDLPPMTFRVPVKPYLGCEYPCQLCGTPLLAGVYETDNIQFCRPDYNVEMKSLQWALDSDLYDCGYKKDKTMLVACRNCTTLPHPWGDGPPITSKSLSTDYCSASERSFIESYAKYLETVGERIVDEQEERAMNNAFTEDEVYELLCQGVKPWDDDAHAVLAALNGAYGW